MTALKQPSRAVLAQCMSAASRAPSIANSQPWLWRITRDGLELSADRSRRLPLSDPDGRSLLISCGATLHHLQALMAAEGWRAEIVRMPDPHAPSLLASVRFAPHRPTQHDLDVAAAIPRRESYRDPMSSWPVPSSHVAALIAVAARHGAFLQPLDNPMDAAEWRRLSAEVARQRADDPAIQSEIDHFSGGLFRASDHSQVGPMTPEILAWSDASVGSEDRTSAESPLLLATSSDDRLAELRAGEALSAVLLEATRIGLVTRVDSQAVQSGAMREVVEADLLQGTRSPQILVVVGWPGDHGDGRAAARRPADSIVISSGVDGSARGFDSDGSPRSREESV